MIQKGAPEASEADLETVPPDRRPQEVQPRWRKDFPIALAQDEYVSRRELVKFIVLTSGAFAAGQLWILFKSLIRELPANLPEAAIAGVDELPVGGAKTFTYPKGSTPRLLVRTGPTAFVAYDQQCTHLLCPVVPRVDQGKLHCPCHNGWFDLHTGQPLAGPPQRGLPKVSLVLREGQVFATGVVEPSS